MSRHSSSGRPWKRLQAQVYDEEDYCWRCGQYVDPALPYNHPQARSVDHVLPRQLGGPDERDNVRLAHRACNGFAATPAGMLGTPAPTPRATVVQHGEEHCADCARRTPHLHRSRDGAVPSLDGVGRSRNW